MEYGFNDNLNLLTDINLTKGQLDNGLTYYTYNGLCNVNEVIFSLVVKIGCTVEETGQRGAAHFTEHLCLSDSSHFSTEDGNSLYDITASGYTNFDETVFILKCIPLRENIERCINALKKIADGSIMRRDRVEWVRRGIINEYKSVGGRTDFKIRQKVLPLTLNNSYYSNLMPIGELECLNEIGYDELIKFHRQWYRPELMAVIAAGNIETGEVQELFKKSFSTLLKTETKKERIYTNIAPYEHKKYAVNYFKNLVFAEIHMYYMHPKCEMQLVYDMKVKLTEWISYYMTENYIRKALRNMYVNAKDVICKKDHFLNKYEFSVIVAKTEDEIIKVLSIMLEQLRVIAEQGISEKDFEESKNTLLQGIKVNFQEQQKYAPELLYTECRDNFLYGEPILSIRDEYELSLNLINDISLIDIGNCQKLWLRNSNMAIAINLPDNQKYHSESVAIIDYLNKIGCAAN